MKTLHSALVLLLFLTPLITLADEVSILAEVDTETKQIILNPKNKLNPKSSCDAGSCYPAVGDLLIGREENITADSTCGIEHPQRYCIVSHLKSAEKCYWCEANDPDKDHSIQKAITSNLNDRLKTWWQSENAPNDTVTIQLDLEAQFHFTHLIMTFKTFRPAAMVIERSNDYGLTWKPYRYFADDCDARFPEIRGQIAYSQVNIDDVICDERYSKIEPSTMGEVIYKALDPSAVMPVDPYSQRVQDWILITNLRINMRSFHTLGDDVLEPHGRSDVNQKYYYALHELIIRGNCFCYGHAEECESVDYVTYNSLPDHMVHGQCRCMHNTAGRNCERCKPMYNDSPWAPAMHHETNECQKCECNGHSSACKFSQKRWDETQGKHGGVCRDCQHNTQGPQCGQCQDTFYQDMSLPMNNPNVCIECTCNAAGSENGRVCDKVTTSETTAGFCRCKKNVMGENCDQCKPGFYNLDPNNPDGCSDCACNSLGIQEDFSGNICDSETGECYCKLNVQGTKCEECRDEFWGLGTDEHGCEACDCTRGSSESNICDKITGNCNCKPNIIGRQCNQVEEEHFVPDADYFCYEAEEVEESTGDVVKEVPMIEEETEILEDFDDGFTPVDDTDESSGESPEDIFDNGKPTNTWTGDGFMNVKPNSSLTFKPIKVSKSKDYCVALRYKMPNDAPSITANIQFERDDKSVANPDSPCYNAENPNQEVTMDLYPGENNAVRCEEKVCLDEAVDYKANIHFGGQASIDSIIVVPESEARFDEEEYVEDLQDFDEETFVETDESIALHEQKFHDCVEQVLSLPKNVTNVCRKKLFGYSTEYHQGARPCDCNEQGSVSHSCKKTGGQCRCKLNVVGRKCDQCAPYTFGFGGNNGCEDCGCDLNGQVPGSMCDRKLGQCQCRPGVTGRTCDKCKPGYFNFPSCEKCQCNGKTETCTSDGVCIGCGDHTEGDHCESCNDGFYGDPTSDNPLDYCRECFCPDGPDSSRQFSNGCHLDPMREDSSSPPICLCKNGYTGATCNECGPGYFGDPAGDGRCQRCECNGNIDMEEGACDRVTGDCLSCKRFTTGKNCEKCLHGYFPDGQGGCQACQCSSDGTNPEHCENGLCSCSQVDGSCDCLDTVNGDRCEQCKPQFYGLKSGEGCTHCSCHASQSVIPDCHQETGQCRCHEGFGGRDCGGCEVGYYGDPNGGQCDACQCDPDGSIGQIINGQTVYPCNNEGKCECQRGIGGQNCNQCDYGFYAQLMAPSDFSHGQEELYCEACDQCFTDWDNVINSLKSDSKAVLDTAEELQRTGITGQYTNDFTHLDTVLHDVERILEESVSPQVENKLQQFQALRDGLNSQRGQVLRQQALIQEVQKNDNGMLERLTRLNLQIKTVDIQLGKMKDIVQKCAASTPEVASEQIEKAQQRSADALANATELTHPENGKIKKAMDLRARAEDSAITHSGEFTTKNAEFQRDLSQALDETRDISIESLNEKICGAATESCDNICGGAGCDFCGAKEGEELASPCAGAATQAAQAAAMAKKAKDELEKKLSNSNDMLDKVKNANGKVEASQVKVTETHVDAEELNKQVSSKNAELIKKIQKIKLFLQEKRDNPSDVLDVAEQVLEIPLPTKGDVSGVVDALQVLYGKIPNIDSQLNESHEQLLKAKKLNDIANNAEMSAHEELLRTKQANEFINQADTINTNVAYAITVYTNGTGGWDKKVSDLTSSVSKVQSSLSDVNTKIKEVYDIIQVTNGKSVEISVAADAVRHSTEKSRQNAQEAMNKMEEGNKINDIIDLATTGAEKAKKWIEASKKAQNIRTKADQIRRRVQKHIETLEKLEDDFRGNQGQLAQKRQELETLKEEATELRKALRKKLKFYSTQCANAK